MSGNCSFNSQPTVLVFDSGVGGLSIYEKIRRILPGFRYIYAFDDAAFPYGEKSEVFIAERVVKIVSAVQQHYFLTLVVIACNTASTVSLPILRKKFQCPVLGVVPAIKLATRLTTSGIVGLLATYRTINHPYTHGLIDRFAHERQIVMLGSTELVEIAEAKLRGKTVSLNKLRSVLLPWLRMPEPPNTVVLGCTHFPLLQGELLQVLPKGTLLVDSSTAVARRAAWLLLEQEVPNTKLFDVNVNIAFCMAGSKKTEQLFPVFQHYGFERLEKLVL